VTDPSRCPDEQTILDFVLGHLAHDVQARARIEEHLDRCSICLDLLAAAAEIVERPGEPSHHGDWP
jgi:hypothetical protein